METLKGDGHGDFKALWEMYLEASGTGSPGRLYDFACQATRELESIARTSPPGSELQTTCSSIVAKAKGDRP